MLDEHLDYLLDATKLDAYRAAIGELDLAGRTVLDLGCGVGVLGLLALRSGAERLIAIDVKPVATLARQVLTEAAPEAHVEVIQTSSFELTLSEKVDVILCDHVGCFGIDYGIIRVLRDARQRFLRDDGLIVPRSLRLFLAPVEHAKGYARIDAWTRAEIPPEIHGVRSYSVNTKHFERFEPDNVLSEPSEIARIDLMTEQRDFLSWEGETQVLRDGVLHGLGGWFECTVAGNARMTNSPLAEHRMTRPQIYLPVEAPIEVRAGDRLRLSLSVRPEDDILVWSIEHPSTGRRLRHSTIDSLLLDKTALHRSTPDYMPRLTRRGAAALAALNQCDGTRSVSQIEQAIESDFADPFASTEGAANFVRWMVQNFTE